MATLINVVLMLNLLISILGNSYDQFQIEKPIIDYTEKAKILLEVQEMMFWRKKKSGLQFIHVLASPFEEEDEDWEGKVVFLEKKINKNLIVLQDDMNEIKSAVSTMKESLETKIATVESKINSIEGQMLKKCLLFEILILYGKTFISICYL